MPTAAPGLRWMPWILGATLGTGTAFLLAIVLGLGQGYSLHEVAASVLLVLLVVAAWASRGSGGWTSGVRLRILLALTCLVLASAFGGTLALGLLPSTWSGIPLVPLCGVLAASADGCRLAARHVPVPAAVSRA